MEMRKMLIRTKSYFQIDTAKQRGDKNDIVAMHHSQGIALGPITATHYSQGPAITSAASASHQPGGWCAEIFFPGVSNLPLPPYHFILQ